MKGALVTGAGVRIGRALAMALAEDGFFVFVHYNRSAGRRAQTVADDRSRGRQGQGGACRSLLGAAGRGAGRQMPRPRRAADLPGEQRLAVQARPRADGQGGGFRPAHGDQSARAAAAVAGAGAATAGTGETGADRQHARPEALQPQSRLPDLHAVQGRPAGADEPAGPGLRAAAPGVGHRAGPYPAQRQPDRRPLRRAACAKSARQSA